MTQSLVQLGRGFGPVGTIEAPDIVEAPVSVDAPSITAEVVGDDIVVTIDGEAGATSTVLCKLTSDSVWSSTTGGAIVTISDPGAGLYYIIAYSTVAGTVSPPSNLVTATVLPQPDQGDDYVSPTGISVTVDGDSLVVSISGMSGKTHRVLYKPVSEANWKEGGYRVGNGTVTISSLPAASYHVQVKSF